MLIWFHLFKVHTIKAGEPELKLGFFEGAGAIFSDVSGAGAVVGAIKIFGSSSSYPIMEKM